MKGWLKRAALLLIPTLIVGVAVLAMLARSELIASLPITTGTLKARGLSARVEVARDALGLVTLRAATVEDACHAQGFVHAQDRFVQMDALRRYASGRLSEVFGASTVESDRRMRPHDFERRADEVLKRLPERHRALLRAYAAGVNEGVRRLGAKPPEYVLLRAPVRPWMERDALLVQYAMWDMLAMNRGFELMQGTMRAALPAEVVDFLTPDTTRFDSLVEGDTGYAPRAIPPQAGAPQAPSTTAAPASDPLPEPLALGSNAFVISGARTGVPGGPAILANDMHLPLKVPAVWHRCRLLWTGGRVEGLSLPGVPMIVAGTNGSVAWGFTNVEGDFEDWVLVETDPTNPERYVVAPGETEEFGRLVEQIDLRDGSFQRLEMRTTRWGPVSRTDALGRPLVARWIAHDTDRTNLNILDMATATTIERAVDVAASWCGPPQNVMIAAASGRIAWVVSGSVPVREGFDGSFPVSWATPGVGWKGWLDEAQRPRVIDPASGFLVTANNRTLAPEKARAFGRAWANPSRAARIAALLSTASPLTERDLLKIQLDTERGQMAPYRDLAKKACAGLKDAGDREKAREALDSWNGTADADQRGFALLRQFRAALRNKAFAALIEPCVRLDPKFRYSWFNDEEPLRRLLEERPARLLPPGAKDWDEVCVAALEDAVEALKTKGPRRGLDTTWGEVNRAGIEHPLYAALKWLPGLDAAINMPRDPLPGDGLSVRAQTAEFGASQRLVVAPGREEAGVCQLPCGNSGHPLSPHYRDQQAAWVNGDPAPLSPGPDRSLLVLEPER